MKFTEYYKYTRQRQDRALIKPEWVEFVFYHPDFEQLQADGRIRRWAYIKEAGKYLRVVILEDRETIHNAFFDRSYQENKNEKP